jgi:hypothetical protein
MMQNVTASSVFNATSVLCVKDLLCVLGLAISGGDIYGIGYKRKGKTKDRRREEN